LVQFISHAHNLFLLHVVCLFSARLSRCCWTAAREPSASCAVTTATAWTPHWPRSPPSSSLTCTPTTTRWAPPAAILDSMRGNTSIYLLVLLVLLLSLLLFLVLLLVLLLLLFLSFSGSADVALPEGASSGEMNPQPDSSVCVCVILIISFEG